MRDYIYVVICDTYIFCNEFTVFLHISVAWVWKMFIKNYIILDQGISTLGEQQCIKNDNLIHWYVLDKKLSPMEQNGDEIGDQRPRNK